MMFSVVSMYEIFLPPFPVAQEFPETLFTTIQCVSSFLVFELLIEQIFSSVFSFWYSNDGVNATFNPIFNNIEKEFIIKIAAMHPTTVYCDMQTLPLNIITRSKQFHSFFFCDISTILHELYDDYRLIIEIKQYILWLETIDTLEIFFINYRNCLKCLHLIENFFNHQTYYYLKHVFEIYPDNGEIKQITSDFLKNIINSDTLLMKKI